MIELIISGIGFGIVLSFATGPVFFALIKTSIEKGFWAGASLAGGVLLSDIIYVAISIYGSSYINMESKYRVPIGILGSVILFSIGIYYLLKKIKINYDKTPTTRHYTGFFFKGFLMCIFNPGLLLYWVSVTSGIISVKGKLDAQETLPFFASILVTQFSMDLIKAYLSNKLRYMINQKTLHRLNLVAGGLMIIFALRLVYGLLF